MCYHVGIKSLPNTIDLKGQEDPIRSPKKSAAVMILVLLPIVPAVYYTF